MRFIPKFAMAFAGAAALTGCVQPAAFGTSPMVEAKQMLGQESHAKLAGPRAEVNEGAVQLEAIAKVKVPSLRDLQTIKPAGIELDEEMSEEDKLRRPALRETAMSYGARGGLSHTSRQINIMLQKRAPKLDQIYDFSNLVIRGPDNVTILPPVISEAKQTYELSDAGNTLRVADQVYEIIDQARFAPVKPLWYSYLIREYSAPNDLPDEILPKTPAEREIWKDSVAEGWKAGVKQANEIFRLDMNRLSRDFEGMARYKRMLSEGKVSAPIVAKAPMGVTGDGSNMRVNDRAIRITKAPELLTDTSNWAPTISTGPAADYITPNGETSTWDFPTPANRKY